MRRQVLFSLALFFVVLSVIAGSSEERSVEVKETPMRERPGFLGTPVMTLSYGDRVQVLDGRQDWTQGRFAATGAEGWIHNSALTSKRIIVNPSTRDVERSATDTEVALAGRGFNEEVEARYRAEQGLEFSFIDRIEEREVPVAELAAFVEAGELNDPDGGE